MNKGFLKAGHVPTLFAAFLYFDLSFMVWVMLGPLGVQIAARPAPEPGRRRGFMVAVPVLAGALFRVVNGVLVDRCGPSAPASSARSWSSPAWRWPGGSASTPTRRCCWSACVLGVAGASFAVALPLASRWYPPEHQGMALGIAGAGNSGTVLAALFAPAPGRRLRLEQRARPGLHPADASPSSSTSCWPRTRPDAPAAQALRRLLHGAARSATPGGSCSSTA